jgi:hypothetical protein
LSFRWTGQLAENALDEAVHGEFLLKADKIPFNFALN